MKPVVAAVDDGYAEIKALALVDGAIRQVSFASRVRSGRATASIGEGARGVYEVNGAPYTVHEHIDGEDTRFDGYPESDLNHALVHHALSELGLGGRRIRLVSGLPLGRYYVGGERADGAINAKRAALVGARVVPRNGEAPARIMDHLVYPQGVAAWMDYAILPGGQLREDVLEETVAVVDIGGRTTDVAVVLPGRQIDHTRCGTLDQGVMHVVDDLLAMLRQRFGLAHISQRAGIRALRSRRFTALGEHYGIEEEVARAVMNVGGRIMRMVEGRLGVAGGAEVDRTVFVGGGAEVMHEAIARYARTAAVASVEAPAFANARGMLKYTVHVDDGAGNG